MLPLSYISTWITTSPTHKVCFKPYTGDSRHLFLSLLFRIQKVFSYCGLVLEFMEIFLNPNILW